jgi:hypothetical protein
MVIFKTFFREITKFKTFSRPFLRFPKLFQIVGTLTSQNVHILSLEIIVSREGLIYSPYGGVRYL